jgi:uncharacterized membrane protein YgdD (TMEM256/DUF423 family)
VSTENRALLCFAGVSLLVATIGGALAAHALSSLDAGTLHAFEIAVDFEFFNGLGLIAVVLTGERHGGGWALKLAAWLLVAGTVLFCGGIYATSLGAPAVVGYAAPVGGIAFMLAWVLFAWGGWRLASS